MFELSMTVLLGIMPGFVIGSVLHAVTDTGGARWHFNTVLLLAVPLTIALFVSLPVQGGAPSNGAAISLIFLLFIGPLAFILTTAIYAVGRLKAPKVRVGFDVFAWVTGTVIVGVFAWRNGLYSS